MSTINQTTIQLSSKSASNSEFSDRVSSDNADFASLLLEKNSTTVAADENKPNEIFSRISANERSLHEQPKENFLQLDQQYRMQQRHLGTSFQANAQTDHTKSSTNEKIKAISSVGVSKRSGALQTSNRKEVYEQSAFAINKLSYLDSSKNIDTSKHAVNVVKLNDVTSTYSVENNINLTTAELPVNHNAQFGYAEVSNELRDQEMLKNKALNGANSTLSAHPMDKSRLIIAAHKNEQHLYVRDYFSSHKELDLMISNLFRSIKFTVSKIFVNGKER